MKDELLFFSENVLDNQADQQWITEWNQAFLGVENLDRVHALETPLSFVLGMFSSHRSKLNEIVEVMRKIRQDRDPRNDSDLPALEQMARNKLLQLLITNHGCAEEPL